MELIASEAFAGKYSADQLTKLYSNLRSRTIAKEAENRLERNKTGGGVPKFVELKDYERRILEMVRVAERIEGTLDSESTESSIHVVAPTENQEVAPKKPKIQSKQPIEQS